MKICLYNVTTTIKIGGIETFYWEIARKLRLQGHNVELVAGEGPFMKYEDIPLRTFPFTPREKIFDLGNRFRKWGERLSFFKNAWPTLKQERYDLFIIHKPLDFFVAYFVKKRSPNTKVLFVSGGEDFYGFDRFFARYIDTMVAVSRDNAKKIEDRYRRAVSVVPNGVDLERFRPIPEARKAIRDWLDLGNAPTLISVGRIVGWKGFQLVIEALLQLPEYKYILIGEGEYLEKLVNLAENIGVSNRVRFLGAIEHRKLPQYLSAGDIFLQPSIGHEAFGITIIEAMACDIPVVASRNGGIVDIVDEKTNGLLFEVGNIGEMIASIKEIENNLWSPRKYVERFFTWKKTVDKILKLIEEDKT